MEAKPWDPITLAGTAGTLALITLAAAWLPRAAALDPMYILRTE
jgi:hypothetical protein